MNAAGFRRECLLTASEYVSKDRNSSYGEPEDNFLMIARLQEVIKDCPSPELKVALDSILLKVARLARNPTHIDSWVDIAGYAACGYGIVLSRKKEDNDQN